MSGKTEIYEEVCPFCGKKRNVYVTTKDCWEEHRGNSWKETSYSNEYCDCTFGKMCKEKVEITPCCENCKFYNSGYCQNKEMLDSIFYLFEPAKEVKIKDPSYSECKYHELNTNIFERIITIRKRQKSRRNPI